ncbi:MAG: c-type cytochrome [Burkholderiaceae bacterium]|nr:MAG: c-type cytochrome [Burkholderiaceae bacterium]
MKFKWVAGAAMLASSAVVMAQDQQALYLEGLAVTCAACHGIDGRVHAGPGVPALAGKPAQELVRQMRDFKSGTSPATVMQQISKGYSDAQIEQIARYFSSQTP